MAAWSAKPFWPPDEDAPMFRNYLAAALRNLQRNGLYAGLTIMGLAIGFASAILIGLYVRHELTYDQFIPGHERTYIWNQKVTPQNKPPLDMDLSSGRLADDFKLDFPQIQYIARLYAGGFPPAIRHGDVSISETFGWADPDFFKVMPVPAVAGDPGTALESPDSLVLTRAGARKYFHRDTPLGEVLQVDGHPMRVAAVIEDLPSNSNLTGDVFGASTSAFSPMKDQYNAGYSSNSTQTYVRLKPGIDASEINAALPAFLQRRVEPQFQSINPDLRFQYAARLKPITAMHLDPATGDQKPGGDAKVVAGIAIIGVLIVIVAAINFVTLMTARASRRAMEVGVRKALGAERKDLIIQFMGEAFIYVVVALVFAVALAELLLPAVNAALQRKMAFHYLTDPGLLATILGVTLVTGLLAGLYPALVLSAFRPASVLKGGPIGGGGGGRVRQALVVAQFAVLITLVLSTATIYRQTLFSLKDATHTNKDNVVMLFASPCTDALRDAVRAVPGVRLAACSSPMAVNLSSSDDVVFFRGHNIAMGIAPVDFDFFDVYGIKPVAGRLFRSDRPGDDGEHMTDVPPTIVLNETGARTLGFPNPRAAIGQLVTWHFNPTSTVKNLGQPVPPGRASEVIGVVPDFTFDSVRSPIHPIFYYVGPKNDVLNSVGLNIKLEPKTAKTALKQIDQIWTRMSGGQPLQQYYADQFLLRLYVDSLIQGGFIAVCALIAVSIACLGLFSLSAFTAERRTKEIGVRKAMGASTWDILRLLLWQFAKPVLLANVIAWPLGYLAMNWWLHGFAYHVEPSVLTFVGAAVAAVVIALLTVASQSWSVARAKPVRALRYE
jgi:putative ABC transport system permease protein